MTLVSARNLHKAFGDQVILRDTSFMVRRGDHIALVGRNGVGKTTLLDLIAGLASPDAGEVVRAGQCVVDYMAQEKAADPTLTLREFVTLARPRLAAVRDELSAMERHLHDHPGDMAAVRRMGDLQTEFERLGGFSFDSEMAAVVTGLGFSESRLDEPLSSFSGGERNRAALARVLLGEGSLLLLDEPTNHLDIEGTEWLEEYLRNVDKACILVSHDRAFLDAVAGEVWELEDGRLERYQGGFQRYLAEREHRRQVHEHRYRHQQQEIARIEEFIRRNIAGQKTRQAQSRLKLLSRIERLPPPRRDDGSLQIDLQSAGRSFAHVLAVKGVTLAYGDRTILEDVDFDLYRGDRMGLVGRNGCGKSTLLRSLIGELEPVCGSIRLGNRVTVGYFDQELSDLPTEGTMLQALWEVDPAAEVEVIRSRAARFGFVGEDVLKSVRALSGGEKTKLCLARLVSRPVNLLILDEPTNHLDLPAREALEQALTEYDGTLLVVSHDRFFLDRVVNRIAWIHEGRLSVYPGTWSDVRSRIVAAPAPPAGTERRDDASYRRFKEQSRLRGRRKKQLQAARERLESLEAELKRVEDELAGGIPADDWERLHQAEDRKRRLEDEILRLYEQVERLEQDADR